MRYRIKPGTKVVYEHSQNSFIKGVVCFFHKNCVHVVFDQINDEPTYNDLSKFTRLQTLTGEVYFEYLSS